MPPLSGLTRKTRFTSEILDILENSTSWDDSDRMAGLRDSGGLPCRYRNKKKTPLALTKTAAFPTVSFGK